METLLYGVLFLISFIYLIILLFCFKEHISVYYVLLSYSIICINLGYWQLSCAKTLDTALCANQIIYIGASFVGFFMAMCAADLCKTKIPGIVGCFGILGGCITFAGSMTIGKTSLYYKNVDLMVEDGYSYLVKEYGPLHIIYPVYLMSMMIVCMVIIIRSFYQRRTVSYISSLVTLLVMFITTGVYFGERILHFKMELMPIAYVIGFGGILILLKRIKLYDIAGFSAASIKESHEYGFVICDSMGRLSAGDYQAREWFPELNELQIDYKIKDFHTDFLEQLHAWMSGVLCDNVTYYERQGKIIEASHSVINEHNKNKIHCIRLRDDTKQQQYTKLIENYNETLKSEVDKMTDKLSDVQEDIIISMASIVENRDNNTGGHIKRTSDVVRIFIDYLMNEGYSDVLSKGVAECIVKAAPLHDFGKIAISDVILNKPGKFTEEEYNQMKEHPDKGAVIVARILQSSEDILFKNIAVNVAHYHHEKWNGTGYPEGLKNTEIPFEARVMALADVFDALVSKRVYKEQFGYDKAFSIIEESCGSHFDPDLCMKFLECRSQLEELYDSYED